MEEEKTNQQKEALETQVDERDEKCVPMAEKIIQLIAVNNPTAKEMNYTETINEYEKMGLDILQALKDSNLTIGEVNYTWQIVQRVIDSIRSMTNESIQTAFENLESKLFGVDKVSDITLQKIDDMLQ